MNDSRTLFDPLEALTVKQVAALLHVSRPTVVKYIKLGELPSVTIGQCRRIRRVDLEEFLHVHRTHDWRSYRTDSVRQEDYRYGANDFANDGDEVPY